MNDMNRIVIIPSAILVPEELQTIGKLPAIIYPVNQKIVFDYLYEQYKDISRELRVICCINADKVHRRLSSYDPRKIRIETLSELSDLGHTIYYGLNGIECPIVINFSDTIVMEENQPYGDFIYYSEDYLSDTWTFFKEEKGVITEILDQKNKIEIKNEKEKLVVGVFGISDPQYFRDCLKVSFAGYEDEISTFYYALRLYSKKNPLTPILSNNWFDIGHVDTYYNSRLEVRAREFNHISIDKNRGILVKSSDDKDKFIGEIKWYLKLPGDIEYVRPRIFNYSTSYNSPYVSMEYYSYHTIHELFLYGDLSRHQWIDIFKRIRFIFDDFKRYTIRDEGIRQALEDVYLTKTLMRLRRLKSNKRFRSFFDLEINVNGIKFKSLNEIVEILKECIPNLLYDVDCFHIIHGDLCFANIMVDHNFSFVKVIDPRGKFGNYDIYGDSRYELAKLFHSIDGKYDFIIKDLFLLHYDLKKATISYEIINKKTEYDLYNIFREVFNTEIGTDLCKIELIEALLFLSMIPLHGESLNHQLVMLATGLEILNRVVDIKA